MPEHFLLAVILMLLATFLIIAALSTVYNGATGKQCVEEPVNSKLLAIVSIDWKWANSCREIHSKNMENTACILIERGKEQKIEPFSITPAIVFSVGSRTLWPYVRVASSIIAHLCRATTN